MSVDPKYLIKVDDIVHVNFNNGQDSLAYDGREVKVMYIPVASGDSWIFFDEKGNDIYYVSEGCTISKKLPPRPGIDDKF
jgi:hypothetical protein